MFEDACLSLRQSAERWSLRQSAFNMVSYEYKMFPNVGHFDNQPSTWFLTNTKCSRKILSQQGFLKIQQIRYQQDLIFYAYIQIHSVVVMLLDYNVAVNEFEL